MVGIHYRWDFIGLSTDQKPTPETSEKVVNGSTFYCSDNSKLYVFCDGTWYERKPLGGGGGGGGSYVAGTGIDITDDTISVDTTTIQEKLTAGSNVTISDNTISATDTTYSNFVGTDGTAAGTAGLVPAPTTTDAGKFLKADGTWGTAGGGGGIVELTSADYNYPTNNPNGVGLWKLNTGMYHTAVGVRAYYGAGWSINDSVENTFVIEKSDTSTRITFVDSTETPVTAKTVLVNNQNGNVIASNNFSGKLSLSTYNALNALNNDTYISTPLSSYQGRVLNDKITGLVISGAGAPTTATVGTVGKLYEDTTNGDLYICTDATNPYVWEEVGAGGSGPTVVQTTGNSTTDVMSQNAVTKTLFQNNDANRIKIGSNASTSSRGTSVGASAQTSGERAVAIGDSALASGISSVAIGRGSQATTQGQFDIGDRNGDLGYNNSAYRLLSGVYDGQSAHDAATKGQLDSIAIQNAGAPTTATVGTVGQLLEDTTNGKLYICTDTTGGTYTWVEVGAGGGGPTVVQTTGTSTTDVMSQNAVTGMVYADPATQSKVKIGAGTSSSEGTDGVEIGHYAGATGVNSVAIGAVSSAGNNAAIAIGPASYATGTNSIFMGDKNGAGNGATGSGSIGIGVGSRSTGQGSVALGATSRATTNGQFDIGANDTYYGYNSSNYRLLTGLYDPQSAHDAATKGYVDPTTDSSAPTTATVGRLGQIQIDTTNADAYMCVAVDDATPAYTWKKITA